MITLVIAEDHQALIDGIKSFMKNESDIEIVGYANDGFALIEIVRQLKPNVVITDIRMPKCDGIAATKTIKTELPNTQIIAFSMFDHDDAISQMKEAGASGYIMKNSSLQTVLDAVRAVNQGYSYFVNEAENEYETPKNELFFSNREKEILLLIAEGKSSQEIADVLFIEKSTVDSHRKNMSKKIKIIGKTDLIKFALERKYDYL
ncbi:response regulator transcription factor [Flavobacterium sp. J49]|uniref:response regulator transcription factor n=1 Tax=Flavobacterium sp. J49 TaxID=2718534 RepID=UPI0015940B2B|nr:response regulator transcription factor [Flavobacterium sp. J49]MBF6640051.1 response regulator transcription factor [Flavobacterium sp. J49]NIC01296.1 response regulator transcription factor [Flavobacterium sp. J49]